jgi:hypothetical protein
MRKLLNRGWETAKGIASDPARVAKVLAILAIGGFLFFMFNAMFVAPQKAAGDVAEAKQEVKAAEGAGNVATNAMQTMGERTRDSGERQIIVRENTRAIQSAPGASNALPPAVHDAGIGSIRRLREQAGQRPSPPAELPGVRP